MKNQFHLYVATLAILFITLAAPAQGEWKWAHYWTGSGGDLTNIFNNITNTAFDEEGNVYVYGTAAMPGWTGKCSCSQTILT